MVLISWFSFSYKISLRKMSPILVADRDMCSVKFVPYEVSFPSMLLTILYSSFFLNYFFVLRILKLSYRARLVQTVESCNNNLPNWLQILLGRPHTPTELVVAFSLASASMSKILAVNYRLFLPHPCWNTIRYFRRRSGISFLRYDTDSYRGFYCSYFCDRHKFRIFELNL